MVGIKVPLERKFSLVTPSQDSEFDEGWLEAYWAQKEPKTWTVMEAEYRVIVLADAGAGKTHETLNRAQLGVKEGRPSFFIRIEDIDANFDEAFEVGSSEQFEAWLASTEEAWFFLDSIDEARLDNPTAFEKAIRRFAKRIRPAMHRAHIVITSRPYAWRFISDKALVEQYLPFEAVKKESKEETDSSSSEDTGKDEESPVSIYGLKALDLDDIRQFARHHSTPDIEPLITEIQRANLMEMASRPFDLEALLSKWEADGQLGSRLDSLQHMVDVRLDEIDPSRKQRQPLNLAKAREGACRLAAAVSLTGEAGILVPDITHEKTGINAEKVLAEWDPNDVRALLERGIFNDILYGAVRFRHRDIRELLTAEWLYSLLQKGNSRRQIESLLFREQYGEQVIIPRLRPILPWLILFDEPIRERALALSPEIAVESGDAVHLPLLTRKIILNDIVSRIVAEEGDRFACDNSAIARIAQKDLSDEVQGLISKYSDNDDAIFFLGRLVWQGNMENCLDTLLTIALDSNRSIYPRIASVRAVSMVGSPEQLKQLWEAINDHPEIIPCGLLVELAESAVADDQIIGLLLTSIGKLPPYKEYETFGLDSALHLFLDRFSVLTAQQREPLLEMLCVGFNDFLGQKPHHERRECCVSTEFTWLMGPANHAVEILIADRAEACFNAAITGILLKIPAVRHWRGDQLNEYKDKLQELVPAWAEFNDALFWRSVDEARAKLAENGKQLTDDWSVQWLGHYWRFDADSFSRIVTFIRARVIKDDKLVALSLAFRVYEQAEQPSGWKANLEQVVAGSDELEHSLDQLLNPPVSNELERWEQDRLEDKRQREKKRLEREYDRSQWIDRLRASSDKVRNPAEVTPGEWTNDQYWLLREMDGKGLRTERGRGSDWRSLVDEFGEDVAHAFRDAAIKHWRLFTPELRSEGADTSSTPYLLIFGMVGLEFESQEVEGFPLNLSKTEAFHALRYITWELNGFPSWLEAMYKVYPDIVLESVWQEFHWELENTQPDTPLHHILHSIVYHAPWLHSELTNRIQHWIENNPHANYEILRQCFQILDSDQVTLKWFAALAETKITARERIDALPAWYALWVDTKPEKGITAVEIWLGSMDAEAATLAAQKFIVQLLGGRHDRGGGTFVRNFKTVRYLKALYLLMHQYIKVEDDIDRSGKGVYSPKLRDDAQDARSQLFNFLTEIPGKETYVALIELAQLHPGTSHRPWMAKQARKRAEQDADLEPWTPSQVHDFSSRLEKEPASHRQLFDIGALHLNDFKEWLERGNDSLFELYQKASDETEMRKVVAYWINEHARGRYTCAQENPLANDQRPDIWLQHPKVTSPVPIELKLLDKGWTGPYLCERLRNQLAGDYLREETAGCGVFLLVWQGSQPSRQWEIEGIRVGVSELQHALTSYWKRIAHQFSNVSAIDVIVVDLTLRANKSSL